MIKAVFVCGTDTGVGKTVVTGALCAALRLRGLNVGAYKPLESGRGRQDTTFLKKMAGMPESLDCINPYYFTEALAPGVAAQRAGRRVSFKKIRDNLRLLQKRYATVFVEGAGGLIVPVAGQQTNVDLIRFLKTPVLVVARLGLGTINHTLLTLEHLKKNRLRVLGVILNEITPAATAAEKTNPAVLSRMGVNLLGIFPNLSQSRIV